MLAEPQETAKTTTLSTTGCTATSGVGVDRQRLRNSPRRLSGARARLLTEREHTCLTALLSHGMAWWSETEWLRGSQERALARTKIREAMRWSVEAVLLCRQCGAVGGP